MRFWITAIGALALATGFAWAADETPPKLTNPTGIVQSVTIEDLAGIVREIGGSEVQIHDSEGTKTLSFTDGGILYNVAVTFCEKLNPGKCYAFAQLMVLEDKGYTYPTLNKFNIDTTMLTLFKEEAESVVCLARIELVDGGITRERLASAIALYVTEVRETVDKLTAQVVAGMKPDEKTKALTLATDATPRSIAPSPRLIARIGKVLGRPYEKRRSLAK